MSIPCNIAEGAGRGSNREFARFLAISRGSLRELETLHAIALALGYLQEENLSRSKALAIEVSKMLNAMRRNCLNSSRAQ